MLEGLKVLWVAGGRDYTDRRAIHERLMAESLPFDAIITGAARGADLVAEEIWRTGQQLPYIGIPAEWGLHGRSAGYRRNEAIAEMAPDALLAFPGGRGTQHARDLARQYGVPIL